jgi:choline dehydrogenase-like flavoprotein
VFAKAAVNREDFPEVLGTLGILIPGTEKRPYQIQIIGPEGYFWYQNVQEKPLESNLEIHLHASGEIEEQFHNRVSLNPFKRDEYGVPEIKVDFAYSKQDQAVINLMTDALFHASRSMKATLIPTDQQLYTLWPAGQELHEMGTCRMGDDPLTSATNRYGQIHGVSGLFVADNSVIPTSGTANPTLTTVALAIRTVDYITKQFM